MNIPHSQPLTGEQYDEVVRRLNDNIPMVIPEIHLESLEESMAHQAIKRLYIEVGHSNTHLMNTIRITKSKSMIGSPVMVATGSIRVYFSGLSVADEIHPV